MPNKKETSFTIETSLTLDYVDANSSSKRDDLLESYRQRLEARPDSYFLENFNSPKQHIVDPQAAFNLKDLRDHARQHMDEDASAFKLETIHAEIWARTLLCTASLHNIVTQVILDGGDPSSDPLILDHLAAVNLITLPYGVVYYLEQGVRIRCLLLHDENLRLGEIWGSLASTPSKHLYDVALSFAGEQREYAEHLAEVLKGLGIRVFYDKFESANLWGKDLYQHLNEVYKNKSRFVVILISADYAEKQWPSHELRSMQARAFDENREYILPVRFDSTSLPGLNDTTAYMSANDTDPEKLAALIARKLASYGGARHTGSTGPE